MSLTIFADTRKRIANIAVLHILLITSTLNPYLKRDWKSPIKRRANIESRIFGAQIGLLVSKNSLIIAKNAIHKRRSFRLR
jgi:hypothetical protein